MASISIRNLDDGVKKRLRKQAAENGRSLEAEVREILSRVTGPASGRTGLDLVKPLLDYGKKYGGVELEPFPDQILAEAPVKFRRKSRK